VLKLLEEIRDCKHCAKHLPLGPRPILSASTESKIIIVGQAPGAKVHASGIPWKDASGNELRRWLNVDEETFYDSKLFAFLPMGFCYPGKGPSGDMPPRPECAPLWHGKVLSHLRNKKLTILIGGYAQNHYLVDKMTSNLTETVEAYKEFGPNYFPVPHPSPRNRIWQKKNPWFETNVVPALRKRVKAILAK
jgi:uracil-DNA glycosylase